MSEVEFEDYDIRPTQRITVPEEYLKDWCDHAMTILTYWKGSRDEDELTDQIERLAKDMKEFMSSKCLWSKWYDENTPIIEVEKDET